jgi:hypothetical protein
VAKTYALQSYSNRYNLGSSVSTGLHPFCTRVIGSNEIGSSGHEQLDMTIKAAKTIMLN